MAYTEAQQWALVIAPKITGLISLVFSGVVMFTVLIDKEKKSTPYHRLLLGISCVDVSSSFWLGLSTWPIPEETGILLASGTTTSCTVQGFFTQFGITSSLYNASISIFYLLVIRYGWKEDQIRRLEPWLHSIPLLFGLSTAIAGVPLTIFNSANLWCWIAEYKDRGAHADIFRWHVRALERATEHYQFPMEDSFAGSRQRNVIALEIDVSNVDEMHDLETEDIDESAIFERKREVGSSKSWGIALARPTVISTAGSLRGVGAAIATTAGSVRSIVTDTLRKQHLRGRSRDVANQSLRFAGAFYFTWIGLSLTRLLQAINGKTYYPLLLIAAITTPLQGLPNFLVYLYPRMKEAKKKNPHAGLLSWLADSIAPGSTLDSN